MWSHLSSVRWMFLVGALVLTGCTAKPPARVVRPQPGDTVTPRLYHAGPWKADAAVTLMTRLMVDGPDGETTLRPEEVPDEAEVTAEVTFLAGERVLERRAVVFIKPTC